MKHPYYIIGGGIIGSSIAREIRMRDLGDVVVLEKEKDGTQHTSGRNSGVVHSGINIMPGTLKARMCVEGSKKLKEYCEDNNVPMNECGTLVIAKGRHEEKGLYNLLERGKSNCVQGVRIICKDELNEREPAVNGDIALLSPSGAVVDSIELVSKIMEDAKRLGAEYKTKTEVIEIENNRRIMTTGGDFIASHIINSAGLYADRIAHMMGVGIDYMIIPFRGEYMKVNAQINSMVYQVPNLKYPFLGVHFTRTLEDIVLAGPNIALSFGRESYNKEFNVKEFVDMCKSQNFWRMMLNKEFISLSANNALTSLFKSYFLKEINSLLKEPISAEDISPYRAGMRAQIVDKTGRIMDELIIDYKERCTNILNAISPAMTCSLAFAEYVVNNIEKKAWQNQRY